MARARVAASVWGGGEWEGAWEQGEGDVVDEEAASRASRAWEELKARARLQRNGASSRTLTRTSGTETLVLLYMCPHTSHATMCVLILTFPSSQKHIQR